MAGIEFTAEILIVKHDKESPSLFGMFDQFHVSVSGELKNNLIQAIGVDSTTPSRRVAIICKHIADLPEYAAAAA